MGSVRARRVKVKTGRREHKKRCRLVKNGLAVHGITYDAVAREARVSWHMVWCVVNARKVSRRVLETAERLLARAQNGEAA